jgi:asparagine synthase (glutamine-hydrolysing)
LCRIAAIISENTDSLLERIVCMTESMSHGGPDGKGHSINTNLNYALGHRRLSIIDTSENAAQPMHSINQRYSISFNGEIYNYIELKIELEGLGYQFQTASDTEVLIVGYEAWGTNLLLKLKGMFAFILADNIDKKLFIARDHMGIKPLYMAKRGGDIYFSSEVKGFIAIDEGWEPNMDWRIWFLTFGFLPEPITTLQNVWPLKKGYYILYDLSNKTYEEYPWFQSKQNIDISISQEVAITRTKELLSDAVKRHLVADVKLGIFLSGGIDSSLISLLASKENLSKPVETLSIDFEDSNYSEKEYQETVANLIGGKHYSLVVTQKDFELAWEDIYCSLDQPTIDAVNNYFICQFAKKIGFKVVLSGLGADELFGGYPSFNRIKKIQKIKNLARLQILKTGIAGLVFNYPNRKVDFFKRKIEASEYLTYRGLFTPNDTANILNITENEVWNVLASYKLPYDFNNIKGEKNRVSFFESDIYMLNQLLKDADIQSMWHSIELRVPFLDIDVVTFINQIPEQVKYPKNSQKYLIKESFKDIIPLSILNRNKQGFAFPFENWFSKINILKNKILIPRYYYKKFVIGDLSYSRLWAIYLTNTYGAKINLSSLKKIEKPKNLFIYLSAFSKIGGIEKVNKLIIYALNKKNQEADQPFSIIYSLYDNLIDNRYVSQYLFRGFSKRKVYFLYRLIKESKNFKQVLVGHMNLALAIYLMRIFNSKIRFSVYVHGIEVWEKQVAFKKWLLINADQIISVSEYTKMRLLENNGYVSKEKINVLNNAIDPYFKINQNTHQVAYLKKRYNLDEETRIILTLTRMKSSEKYKGYDNVLFAIASLKAKTNYKFKYILAGSIDILERKRILEIIKINRLEEYVILPGYINADELEDFYHLADVFILPSKKEGFGIVFIEAFASGAHVIAGNQDGSVEALQNGKYGTLVNPDNIEEIIIKIESLLNQKSKKYFENIKVTYGHETYVKSLYKIFN